MIRIQDSQSAARAKYEIELALMSTTDWQLLSDDRVIAALRPDDREFSARWGHLTFAWWSEDQSQAWRITAYRIDAAEIRLVATRGLARERVSLTLRDLSRYLPVQGRAELSPREHRMAYGPLLAEIIAAQFVGARVRRLSTGGNRGRSLSAQYARLIVELRGQRVLVIGANDDETQLSVDALIGTALIWLADDSRSRPADSRAQQVWLCVPDGRSQTLRERLTLLAESPRAIVRCFEVDQAQRSMQAVRAVTQAELINSRERELQWPLAQCSHSVWRERIVALAPDLIEVRHDAWRDTEIYSINGLEFARVVQVSTRPRAQYGVTAQGAPDDRTGLRLAPARRLTDSEFGRLAALVGEIAKHRVARPPDRQHPFYRLRPEAWLESLLRRNIQMLGEDLDPCCVWSQIPAWQADDRSVLDLLTINRDGRLVIIEIKESEDLNLPLQGLDYWLRVEQARVRGEFARRRLFPHSVLADRSPLLYLVAPRLRFHRTFRTIAGSLAAEVEAYQLGINSNWREGARLHSKERVNGRQEDADAGFSGRRDSGDRQAERLDFA